MVALAVVEMVEAEAEVASLAVRVATRAGRVAHGVTAQVAKVVQATRHRARLASSQPLVEAAKVDSAVLAVQTGRSRSPLTPGLRSLRL